MNPDHGGLLIVENIFYPFVIGSDSPIPYMHEELSNHLRSYQIDVLSASRDPVLDEDHVREWYVPPGDRAWRRRFRIGIPSLRAHDLLHTGGRGRQHHRISRLTRLRNRDLAHVHTLRIDVDPDSGRGPTRHKHKLVEGADAVTAVSEHTAETARRHLGISPRVIYEGVNPDVFHPDHDRPALFDELGIKQPVFLFVGAFQHRKHPAHVVEIAADHPDVTFLLVGDGETYDEVSSLAENRSNVVVTGRLPKRYLPAVYASATAFVFPSVREGCANVVLEAMASGLPVLGYRATSMPEVVEHGETGYLADPEAVGQLSDYVDELRGRPDLDAMGNAAREHIVSNHAFEVLAEQYDALYEEVL